MNYKHTQIGYLIIFVLLAVIVQFAFIIFQAGYEPFIIVVMTLILFILASFASLQVVIDGNYLKIKFGYGIYKKNFMLSEIIGAKVVSNHWYYGWGIRYWLWPQMVIYNISGFKAVEIVMKDGKIYRIGTDEPQKLKSALDRRIQTSSFENK